ncbi:MAG: SusC/RagA family TonB-linked outer membrane protein [Saprospiraceae bacterium]|nr:SusC/RagA family TonB-linked outer membrane protein [Saprospiraceae bacterium]
MNQKLYTLPKKLGVVWLFLLFAGLNSLTAQRTITGKVSDAGGPIPGASVVIKGTTTGTATDGDGNYSLAVKGDNLTLVYSAVGYTTQEVALGAQNTIDITLVEDISTLQEVVVTGYGIDGTRRQTVGAVSTVKPREIKAVPSGNVEQQLQGRVSGLTVITNGQPGTSSIIRVRGFGSFGGNEPLIIIDGTPAVSTDFLSPDDIESVTVLKDAATASIYGARAAAGVIVYTTKRGSRKSKKMEVSYDGVYGSTDPGKGQAMLNPTDFLEWTWIGEKNTAAANGTTFSYSHPQFGVLTASNKGTIPEFLKVGGNNGASITGTVDLTAEKAKYNVNSAAGPVYQVIRSNRAGTDWYDAITRPASLQRHSLGFSGGSENSQYYIGVGLQDQLGILMGNSFKRYNFRANSEFDLTKNLRIGENLQFTYLSIVGQGGGDGGRGVAADENDILQAFRMPSIIPVYDEFGGWAGTTAGGFNNPRNPVANRTGQLNDNNFRMIGFGNIYAELDVIPGLRLRSNLGGRLQNSYYKYYSRLQYENSENNASFAFGEGAGYGLAWSLTNTANYTKKFGDHSVDVLVGLEALNTGKGRNIDASGINPFSTDPTYVTLGTVQAAGKNVSSNIPATVNFYSTFGRLNYSFKDKYQLTGIIRRDASSRFGANSRTGVFPAVGLGWRITGEDFMKNQSIFQDLKLRAGWGKMGNSNNVNPNNQYSLFGGSVGASSYDITGSNSGVVGGFYRTRIGNPNAQWETAVTSNVGADATLLKGNLDITVELWRKQTEGLLYNLQLPAIVGASASVPAINLANMLNEGIDLGITSRGKIVGDWKYEAILNGSWLKNEITSLAPEANVTYFDGPTFRGVSPIRNQVGQSISAFFGYKMIGYFQTADEATKSKQPGAGIGRFKYEDNNGYDAKGQLTGVPDGKIDAADRTFIGSPVPKFTGGLTLTVTYKNLEISTYLYSSLGNKIYNFSKWYTDFYGSFKGAAIAERVKDSWTPSNTNPQAPIFEQASNESTNGASNSWYVEDGSYLRMQYISIGYNLPSTLLSKIGVKRARINASTNNLFTITKYKGLDPAVGGAADSNFGIDIGNYPLTRSVTVGLSVGF